LPDGTGYELADFIKTKFPAQNIYLMSGVSKYNDLDEHFDGFLPKPFNLSQILTLFSQTDR